MTEDNWRKWNIYTSIHIFEYCVFSWRNLMWMHIQGFTDEERMRELFWYYLNFGNTTTYYD
jgi:hypothetical protein